MAKDLSSPYVEGRTTKWLKVKVHQEDEFVIVGYTLPGGSRQHFGALLLGAYEMKKLYYVGKVGTGFSRESLTELAKKMEVDVGAFLAYPKEKFRRVSNCGGAVADRLQGRTETIAYESGVICDDNGLRGHRCRGWHVRCIGGECNDP